MLSAPSVLQTLYLHYFPLRDLIAFYLTLDISCEIQWLRFQYESIHCFRGRMARANSTLQTWIQKPSHVSGYRWEWLWQTRVVFNHTDYLQGLRFLETCALLLSVKFFSFYSNSPAGRSICVFSSIFKGNLIVWGGSIVTWRSDKHGPSCHPQELNHHPTLPCFYMLALVWTVCTWTGSSGSGFYLTHVLSDVLMAHIRQKNTIVEMIHNMRRK